MLSAPAFVLLIVAMSLSIPILKIWTNYLRDRNRRADADNGQTQAMEAELAELRDRVETLERIVTDERHHLDREFDRLDRAG